MPAHKNTVASQNSKSSALSFLPHLYICQNILPHKCDVGMHDKHTDSIPTVTMEKTVEGVKVNPEH